MPSIADLEFSHSQNRKAIVDEKNNRRRKSRRLSDEMFRSLVDAMNEGVIIINRDGVIVYMNDKFCNMLSCSYEQLTGKPVVDFIDSSSRAILKQKFLNCIAVADRPKTAKGASIGVTWNTDSGETIFSRVSPQLIADNEQGNIFFAVVTDITKSKKAKEALIQSKKELHILSNKLLTAQEQERKRIAGELHDGIGQCLSAIKFKIEEFVETADENGPGFDSLTVLIPLLQDATAEVRRIAMDLRPSILDDLGLKATINWLSREYRAVYRSIELDTSIDIDEKDLSNVLNTVLYRVIQESLNNIAKYAKATRVNIALKTSDERIELLIEDNGIGFTLENIHSNVPASIGLGLSSMKERVELTRGSFHIKSVVGKGTVIQASWPWEPPK